MNNRKGFWTKTEQGTIAHILGNPKMSKETLATLHAVIDAANAVPLPPVWTVEGKANPKDTEWVMLGCAGESLARRQYNRLLIECPGGAYRLLNCDGVVVEVNGDG